MSKDGFGAFGKIPSVGDFFRVNAPAGFVDPWDEWLQRCLVSGAHMYGSQWDALYMSVPIWRFCLSAGLAGQQAVLGVLMPSVDRVGRRFPLTLLTPIEDEKSIISEHFRLAETFLKMEDVALSVLDDDMSKDALSEQLAGLSVPEHQTRDHCRINGMSVVLKNSTREEDIAPILASKMLSSTFQRPSIWSAVMDGDNRLMVCDGLPDGMNMQGLFDLEADVWKEGCI